MPQDEELDVLGGGRAAHQYDQYEHLWKIRYSNRSDTATIMPGLWRPPIASGQRHAPHSGTPQASLIGLGLAVALSYGLTAVASGGLAGQILRYLELGSADWASGCSSCSPWCSAWWRTGWCSCSIARLPREP